MWQVRQALADGVPPAPVLMDPAYGDDSKLRAEISEFGLAYVSGILPTAMAWRPGEAPLPPACRVSRGRAGRQLRRRASHQAVSSKTLALELAADVWAGGAGGRNVAADPRRAFTAAGCRICVR